MLWLSQGIKWAGSMPERWEYRVGDRLQGHLEIIKRTFRQNERPKIQAS